MESRVEWTMTACGVFGAAEVNRGTGKCADAAGVSEGRQFERAWHLREGGRINILAAEFLDDDAHSVVLLCRTAPT